MFLAILVILKTKKMDLAKYSNLVGYLVDHTYPKEFTKQENNVLRRTAKQFEFDVKSQTLYRLSKKKCSSGAQKKLIVIKESEKQRIFSECHTSGFGGHAGRDNTLQKIKDRYYWPNFYVQIIFMH